MDSQGKKAGKGPLISEEVSATLGVSQDQYLFQPITFEPAIYAGESRGGGGEMYVIENHPADSRVSLDDSGKVQTLTGRMGTGGGNTPMILEPIVYGISSYSSNSMKSDNPDSGIYEAKTSRTLDLNGGNPACNQGGMIDLEGNGTRPSHRGDGYLESDKMYTLNTIERHGVCYWDGGQTVGTLTANNAGGAQRMPDKNHFQCIIEQVDSRGGVQRTASETDKSTMQ